MRRNLLQAGLLWLVLTALGEWFVLNVDWLPLRAAHQAVIIDDAFTFLLALAVPVFMFVIAGIVYSVLAFRGAASEETSSFKTSQPVTWSWFAITSALAIFIVFNPGLKGLRELTENQRADLTLRVEAEQWQWTYEFVDQGVTLADADELLLPLDRTIRFEVTATDVIHSFWVPAFRMKVDAVPGMTNVMYVTPSQVVAYEQDHTVRVQCAEMCGTGHPRMRTPVRVVSGADFDQWIADLGG